MRDVEGIASPGLLSPLLARLRHGQADRLIPEGHRRGRILDVGCGTWPAFLVRTRFGEKHGLDRRPPSAEAPPDVETRVVDVTLEALPYPDRHFDVVTLLAIVEHLEPEIAARLLAEVRRVLRTGGVAVLTLPSARGEAVLHVLSALGIASREQHDEHQAAYEEAGLRALAGRAGFGEGEIEVGRFELGLNLLARLTRT